MPKHTVQLVRPGYQPTKAELEEDIVLVDGDGRSPETPADLARAVTRPVQVRNVHKPKAGGST